MFDKINLQDAVRRAIQTEKNAMDFYQRRAESMQSGFTMSTRVTISLTCRHF